MEALAHGNIVVLRDVANNAELVTVNQTGLLFENDADLASTMEEALCLAEKLGSRKQNLLPVKFKQSNVLRKLVAETLNV